MIDIKIYQQFMVDYFKRHPDELTELFGDDEPETKDLLADAFIATNWELDDASHYCFGDELGEEDRLEDLARLQKQYGKEIKEFHRLALLNDKYCGQIVYLILESDLGKLYMDEYVGD